MNRRLLVFLSVAMWGIPIFFFVRAVEFIPYVFSLQPEMMLALIAYATLGVLFTLEVKRIWEKHRIVEKLKGDRK